MFIIVKINNINTTFYINITSKIDDASYLYFYIIYKNPLHDIKTLHYTG